MAHMVKSLLNKNEVLSSNPGTAKNKNKKTNPKQTTFFQDILCGAWCEACLYTLRRSSVPCLGITGLCS
jgi:hypothetical protein